MSLLWCDGFDHYGVDENNMLDGPYAQIDTVAWSLATDQVRTGTHVMKLNANQANNRPLRRVFGAAKTTVGIGGAFYLTNLPTTNEILSVFQLRDANNAAQLTIYFNSTGTLSVWRGKASTGGLLATSAVCITADAWNHIEAKVTIANAGSPGGAVEVRVNNVTVIDISGVDTQATALAEASQIVWGREQSSDPGTQAGVTSMWLDDVFAWDTAGSQNNDFLGDHQVLTQFPDQDTAQADWTQNTGATEVSAIDEANPDDDTTYVAATAAAQVSEYEVQDLPATVSAIAAIQFTGRMKKTDAGTARVQQSLISSAVGSPPVPAEFNGADRNITTAYTYWPDISETDPATGAPWARSAFNSAKYKIERTA